MNLSSLVRQSFLAALTLALVNASAATTRAADETPPARPVTISAQPCLTCDAPGPGCATGRCGHSLFGHKPCKPYNTQLCPGACFGYFQTQWTRWEDVCPLPYQGVGLSDAPPPAPGYLTPVRPNGTLPKMPDPKKPNGTGSELPPPRPAPGTGMPMVPSIPTPPKPGM